MLTRILAGIGAGAVAALALGVPGVAAAQPAPAPNINALPPVNPQDFGALDGTSYAFAVPGGVTCVMDRLAGSYGCSGPLPAAPGGANLVTGYAGGSPGFGHSDRPIYGAVDNPVPLPPNTRMSFRTVSCGTDGVVTSCINTVDQSGFVLSPAGSFTF
ncbi:hypothetical protein [Mycolicibacterium sp.]|uniref:hypothetical protein n=1 Tax=Mycolicibacterium sp. TaxID=2320850 RepID=UPI003D0E5ED7